MTDLKEILSCTYAKRSSLNVRYSRNAFARDLGVSPAALSQFMTGKRTFSRTNLKRIVSSLCLPTEMVFVDEPSSATPLKMETFSVIADWYHFAILNLSEVDRLKSAAAAASRLGISEQTATSAIARLVKLELLEKVGGVYRRTSKALDAGTDVPSEALRKHNREKMELAIESLEKTPLDKRDVSSLTLTFDPSKIGQIKNEIKRFKKRIDNLCGSDQATEVYSLNVQFFPLSKKGSSK